MKSILQITQSQLKYCRKLTQKKYRQAEQKFLIEGIHLVEEALDSDWNIETLLVSDTFLAKKECKNILQNARNRTIAIVEVAEHNIRKLSDTVTTQGIIGIVEMRKNNFYELIKSLPKQSIVVALEDVADPGNVGTILRTCDWFGVQAVLLNRNCVDPFNPKVVRATMGALFHLPVCVEIDLPDAFRKAKENDFNVVVTAVGGGKPLKHRSDRKKTIIVFGNEAHGVSSEVSELADELVSVPKYGKAESLNVAIACGIVLHTVRMNEGA